MGDPQSKMFFATKMEHVDGKTMVFDGKNMVFDGFWMEKPWFLDDWMIGHAHPKRPVLHISGMEVLGISQKKAFVLPSPYKKSHFRAR